MRAWRATAVIQRSECFAVGCASVRAIRVLLTEVRMVHEVLEDLECDNNEQLSPQDELQNKRDFETWTGVMPLHHASDNAVLESLYFGAAQLLYSLVLLGRTPFVLIHALQHGLRAVRLFIHV